MGGQAKALAVFCALVVLALATADQNLAVAAVVAFYAMTFLFLDRAFYGLSCLAKIAVSFGLGFSSLCVATYLVSLAAGYSAGSIAIAMVMVATLYAIVPKGKEAGTGRKAKPGPRALWPDLREHHLAVIATLLVLYGFLAINNTTFWVKSSEGIVVSGWNWGDFPAHVPVVLSVNNGNFPPMAPFLSGQPLNYHWFADFLSAIDSKFTGANAMACMRLENALYPTFIFFLCYLVAFRLCNDKKRALFAALLVLFWGSFAYLKLVPLLEGKSPAQMWSVITWEAHDNDWKEYQMPSFIPGFLLPQRAMMAGLVLFLSVMLLLFESKGDRKKDLLAGILCGFSVPFHFYVAPACGLLAFLKNALDVACGTKLEKAAKSFAAFAVGAAVSGGLLYFLIFSSGISASSYPFSFRFGWLAPADPAGFAVFYAKNLGATFVAFVIAAFAFAAALLWKKKTFAGMGKGEYAALCLLAIGLFLVPNMITMPNYDWDLNKFFVLMFVPAGIAAALFACAAAGKLGRFGWVLLAALFLLSSLSSVFTLAWWYNNRWIGMSNDDVKVGEWIIHNTPTNAVFASYEQYISPIDCYAGRFRVCTNRNWVNSIGDGENARRTAKMRRLFCTGSEAEARSIADEYNVTYVYYGSEERKNYDCQPGFLYWQGYAQVYSAKGVQIFRIER
jgi:hypothetical protein